MNASFGYLTKMYCGRTLPLEVLKSQAGFFIGTACEEGISRESAEYFPTQAIAQAALDSGAWTQHQI
jgi:hypothetical protein